MDIQEFLLNLPGPNRFLVIMSFLLIIMFLTYRNMRNREAAEKELKEKLDDLKSQLEVKENRIRDIHHRVRNNLQLISSMIGLQVEESDRPDMTERLRRCRARVHSISMIHELLDESSDGEQLDVKPYFERLIYKSLQMRNNNQSPGIDVNTDIEQMTLDAEKASACGLVVCELVTNCFQHAFEDQDSGSITIRFSRRNGKAHLSVADDGSGFPEQVLNDESTTIGHDIVRSLVESDLQGRIEFENTEEGARARISFPLSKRQDDVPYRSAG